MLVGDVHLEAVQVHEAHQTKRTLVDEATVLGVIVHTGTVAAQQLLADHARLRLWSGQMAKYFAFFTHPADFSNDSIQTHATKKRKSLALNAHGSPPNCVVGVAPVLAHALNSGAFISLQFTAYHFHVVLLVHVMVQRALVVKNALAAHALELLDGLDERLVREHWVGDRWMRLGRRLAVPVAFNSIKHFIFRLRLWSASNKMRQIARYFA